MKFRFLVVTFGFFTISGHLLAGGLIFFKQGNSSADKVVTFEYKDIQFEKEQITFKNNSGRQNIVPRKLYIGNIAIPVAGRDINTKDDLPAVSQAIKRLENAAGMYPDSKDLINTYLFNLRLASHELGNGKVFQAGKWVMSGAPQEAQADNKISLEYNGVKYESVTVAKVLDHAIQVTTDSGILMVPLESLSKELQEKYNFDPEKAAAARKRLQANMAAVKKQAEQKKQTQESKKLRAALNEVAVANTDDFKQRRYVRLKSDNRDDMTSLNWYISQSTKDPSDIVLFMYVAYIDSSWIFMDKIVFAGEGEPIEYPLDTDSELLRNAQVSEWAHVSLEPEEALEILESAKKFRLAGKSVADYHFTEEEQAKLRTVLMLYREMLPKETF